MRIALYYEENKEHFYKKKQYQKYTEDDFRKLVDDICKSKDFDICAECAFNNTLEENIAIVEDNDCSILSVSALAACQTMYDGKFFCFYFRRELLDGKSHCVEEIQDIILHELAHALADKKHHTNCEHDNRWIDMCNEIGYDKISWGENNSDCFSSVVNFKVRKIDSEDTSYLLRCAECNKVIVETEYFNKALLNRFVFSGSSQFAMLGIYCTVNGMDLHTYTDCCSVRYILEFDSDKFLKEVKKHKNNVTQQLEEIVKRIVEDNSNIE